MSAAPLPAGHYSQHQTESHMHSTSNPDWMRIGIGASLLTGSLLLLTGKRKAGLLLTVTGTALAMLENREVVAAWWEALPQHLQKAQNMLEQTQQTIDDLTAKRDKIFALFGK